MPPNTTNVEPLEDITGTVSLPLARVKKIIATDDDVGAVSAQATFVMTKATELFIQYAAERAWDIAKTETKPKKSLTYTHVANAVARTDNLEFLSDIAPQTTTLRAHKARKAQEAANAAESSSSSRQQAPLDPKQTTLGGSGSGAASDPMDLSGQNSSILRNDMDDANSIRPAPATASADGGRQSKTGLVFQHYAPNGTSNPGGSQDQEDVDMS